MLSILHITLSNVPLPYVNYDGDYIRVNYQENGCCETSDCKVPLSMKWPQGASGHVYFGKQNNYLGMHPDPAVRTPDQFQSFFVHSNLDVIHVKQYSHDLFAANATTALPIPGGRTLPYGIHNQYADIVHEKVSEHEYINKYYLGPFGGFSLPDIPAGYFTHSFQHYTFSEDFSELKYQIVAYGVQPAEWAAFQPVLGPWGATYLNGTLTYPAETYKTVISGAWNTAGPGWTWTPLV